MRHLLGEWRRRRNDAWRRRHGSCDHDGCWHQRARDCPKAVLLVASLLVASCAPSGGGHVVAVRGSASTSMVATGDPLPATDAISDVRATTSTRLPPRASRSRPAPPRAESPPSPPRTAPVVQAVGAIQQAICDAFRAACQWALRVARCESRFNPGATNGSHRGLFQISIKWHAARIQRMGYTLDQMWEVGPNIAVALAIYEEQGGGPWECK